MSELRLATRRSPLALTQASFVQQRLAGLGVASVLVPQASDAQKTLGAIVRDIESQTANAATKPKRSVGS